MAGLAGVVDEVLPRNIYGDRHLILIEIYQDLGDLLDGVAVVHMEDMLATGEVLPADQHILHMLLICFLLPLPYQDPNFLTCRVLVGDILISLYL